MENKQADTMFKLTGQVAVITGGAGTLCTGMCRVLASAGVKLCIVDIYFPAASQLATEIEQSGGEALAIGCDVTDKRSVQSATQQVMDAYGRVDLLINGAGGNNPQATTSADHTFFDLPEDALQQVIDLNLIGTILCCQAFGKIMAQQKKGVIVNISSMNAFRPLTRIPAYSAAKAALSNFTQWLAVHMAHEYSTDIRVNAIAPGFFLTDQNRYLLVEQEDQRLTERGQQIIAHTPLKRFGTPEDLVGTILWLLSPASAFVTGVVIPIDGGFSAFSGV